MLELSQNAVSDQLQIGHSSHPGRSGKNNEDYFGIFSVATTGGECVVATVADGIGGSVGGERASRLAVSTLRNSLNDQLYLATSLSQRLDQAIRLANREIYEKSQNEPALAGMGTTIVAVALDSDRLYVAHAGDSRAYLVRGGHAHQLTLDHSWAQEAIEAGRITPEDAKTHPNRHVIRRFLGINEEVEVDPRVVDPAQIGSRAGRPTTVVSPILTQPGDAIVLCSDGLTDDVGDEEIARIVSKYAPEDAARRLVDAANAAGGADNITVVILRRGGSKLPAAAGRSRLVAYALAVAGLLLVGGLGWLLAGSALLGRPDGSATALNGTPSVEAALLITGTAEVPLTQPGAAVAATSTPVPSATAAQEETPTATFPATATAVSPTSTAQPAAALLPSVENTATATLTSTATSTLTEAVPSSTSTPVSISGAANPSEAAATEAEAAVLPTASATEAGLTATPTVAATSTPVGPVVRATATSTVTPTPTPTIVVRNPPTSAPSFATGPTRTPVPTAAASAAQVQPPPPVPPTPAPVAVGGPTRIDASAPPSGKNVNESEPVIFSWSPDAPPAAGQVFELVFWKAIGETYNQGRAVNTASTNTSVTVIPGSKLGTDSYKWGVFLAQENPWERIRFLGEGGSLTVSASGSDDDNQDSAPDDGAGGNTKSP